MPNRFIEQRLAGIRTSLNRVHQASAPLTNNTSGAEREVIINNFLSAVFPSQFRFGNGDITNAQGTRSSPLLPLVCN